jgi:hypothetical protein
MTLGGHAIPIDRGTRDAMIVIGVIGDHEAKDGHVPGMERAIPKNKGIEFASLVHQLGAEMVSNPYSPALHKLLLEIAPDAKDRLPKRQAKPKAPPPPPPRPEPKVKEAKEPVAKAKPAADKKKLPVEKAPAEKPAPEKPAVEKSAKAASEKRSAKKPPERKPAAAKRAIEPKKSMKKPPAPKKPAAALSKRKPR